MTAFETILAEVFERGAEQRLDRETERATIREAQLGAEAATVALIYAYAAPLRSLASKHGARLGVEEARSVAVSGLIEAIHAFDLERFDGQLAGIIFDRVSNALRETDTAAVAVPFRTKRRFLEILRKADGDIDAGALLAPQHGMTAETFHSVREALNVSRYDAVTDGDSSGGAPALSRAHSLWDDKSDDFGDADDRALVDLAFTAVAGVETDVVRHAYGFENGDPMSDGEIAQAISVRDLGEEAVSGGQSAISRAGVQRVRSRALGKMRNAVAAGVA